VPRSNHRPHFGARWYSFVIAHLLISRCITRR
jgi:hypothetical protein